jgi:hypothetical protein
MTREERLEVAVRIAAEFTARDMRQHLPPLRRAVAAWGAAPLNP